jgi:sarcosine oxidase subunit gamma
MADLADYRVGPLSVSSLSVGGVSMALLPNEARFVFRARGAAVDTAGHAFGIELPRQAHRTGVIGARTALWMGPDEWLLLGPESEKTSIRRQITEALTGAAHSLVDVSHRDAALALSGSNAAAALNAGCPLDLHPSVFAVGMCARTLLAKADIVLWRTGPVLFHVQTWRSMINYVWRFLEHAGRDGDR